MFADVSKLMIIVMVLMTGCHAGEGETMLSERYQVCANLPPGASYHTIPPGPDFELGVLKAKGVDIGVQIGGHPRFSHRVIRKGLEAVDEFRFLGKERSDEQEKLLFAHNRGDREGPVYVLLSAPDMHSVERSLTRPDFLVDCN